MNKKILFHIICLFSLVSLVVVIEFNFPGSVRTKFNEFLEDKDRVAKENEMLEELKISKEENKIFQEKNKKLEEEMLILSKKTIQLELTSQNAIAELERKRNEETERKKIEDELNNLKERAKKLKILCWATTFPDHHETRAKHVKETWGKRCDVFYFVSTQEHETLPAFAVNVTEGRESLWTKTRFGFKYAYENHFAEIDWFLKADDDTFIILENLRHMLVLFNTWDPIWFGGLYSMPGIPNGYMSGGAGYVLGKEALSRFVKQGLDENAVTYCPLSTEGEDVLMGLCLGRLDVKPVDTRDEDGKLRFYHYQIKSYVMKGMNSNWDARQMYAPESGANCCSAKIISFHYVSPEQMYLLDYLMYTVRIF